MPKDTIKSLNEKIKKLRMQLKDLSEQNDRLLQQADQEFLNSYEYRELSEKAQFLRNYVKTLENENQRLKHSLEEKNADMERLRANADMIKNLELVSISAINEQITKQNRKHAGRRPVLSAEEREEIVTLRIKGASIRVIAEQIGCSVGTVHRILTSANKEEV